MNLSRTQKKQLANTQRRATILNQRLASSGNDPALLPAAIAAYREYQELCTELLAQTPNPPACAFDAEICFDSRPTKRK